jgi:hypothetical protein
MVVEVVAAVLEQILHLQIGGGEDTTEWTTR